MSSSNNMPEITVLTAVRNGIPYLAETLQSIQNQTFKNWEYIIVDDASNDDTPYVLEAAAKADSRLHIIRRSTPGGPFIAANEGLQHAKGFYVARTDADDISLPDRFEKQLAFLHSNVHLRACGSYAQAFNETGVLKNKISRPSTLPNSLKWELGLGNYIIHSTAFMEREALLNVYSDSPAYELYKSIGEGIDATSNKIVPDGEDTRMWCKLARLGWVGIIPEILVLRRLHKQQVTKAPYLKTYQDDIQNQIVKEHLEAILGKPVHDPIIHGLGAIVHLRQYPMTSGIRTLNEWRRWWTSDTTLSGNERNELKSLYNFVLYRFLFHQFKLRVNRNLKLTIS